jgi:hypothetical protein
MKPSTSTGLWASIILAYVTGYHGHEFMSVFWAVIAVVYAAFTYFESKS